MRYGFVGYGNMGSMLIKGLLEHGAMAEQETVVTNRNKEKLDALKQGHPGVDVVARPSDVAKADVIFLCVRTGDVKSALEEILPYLRPKAHIVTINGGLQIKNLEKVFPGMITKAIPSMTLGSGHGVTLICHNRCVDTRSARIIEGMFERVGMVQIVKEDQFEIAADLTSCAPAFITAMAQHFAEAGSRRGDLESGTAMRMVVETLLGTALTLSSGEVGLDELRLKVATKGGITEQGLAVLDRELPRIFDQVLEATTAKHELVKDAMTNQFEK
ncbi:MAG TPA: pyrroline-5-carboxylate reductase dimerization domain-containing protein [Methanomassiliicoccales archaeon]|jgi:pyrroline-5-carboxylate reductase